MKRKRIAALMAGLNREYQQEFSRGMAAQALPLGIDLCIFNCQGYQAVLSPETEHQEGLIFDLPDLNEFDGITALLSTLSGHEHLRRVQELLDTHRSIPQVVVDAPSAHGVSIGFDDGCCVRQLVEHLLKEHGFRRFALLAGPFGNPVADLRLNTALDTLAKAGCPVSQRNILCGFWTKAGGRQCAEELLRREDPLPEALVCFNDDMAMGAIQVLENHGLSVPGDICVTGFDGRGEAIGCGVTTIRRPVVEAGSRCVELLAGMMDGHAPEKKQEILPTELILGHSCGCPMHHERSTAYIRDMSWEHQRVLEALIRTSTFSNALTGAESLRHAGDIINSFAGAWGLQEMHVCVRPDILEQDASPSTDVVPEQMLQISGYSSGKISEQKCFPTRSLLPVLEREDRQALALVFSPLYYASHSFGYVVMDMQFAASLALYSLLSMLDGSLMNLVQQQMIRAYARRVEQMSLHDSLTGLLNRRGFRQEAEALLAQAIREARPVAMLSADMDGMKRINDSFGHLAGDQAIARMGTAMRSLEKRGICCAHISGDEFVAVGLCAGPACAARIKADLKEALAALNREDPWVCDIGASIGVYVAQPASGDTPEDLLQHADEEMYREKRFRHAERENAACTGKKQPNPGPNP